MEARQIGRLRELLIHEGHVTLGIGDEQQVRLHHAGGRGVRGQRLQRHPHLNASGHVQKDTALPQSTVQGRDGIGIDRHGLGHEVRFNEIGVLLHRAVEVAEDDSLPGQIGFQRLPQGAAGLVTMTPPTVVSGMARCGAR